MSFRELSACPDLEQYKKQAKELVRECGLGETVALERVKQHHPRLNALPLAEIQTARVALADAQLVIARELQFESWPKLAKYITTENLIRSVASLPDPTAAFLQAACVPSHTGHGTGTVEHAEMILARYPGVRGSDIFVAAVLGDEASVRRFLSQDASLATVKDGAHGWDALTYLCFSRYLRIERERSDAFVRTARALLDAGADANTGWYGLWAGKQEFESAIYGAAGVAQNAELTRLLLERGADPNDEETTYHVAETYDNRVMEVLLKSGKLNTRSLVTLLVRKGDWHDIKGMRMALEHQADPNAGTMWGYNGFQHALRRDNRLEMIELLLEFGADPSLRNARDGRSGFELAAGRGRGDVLDLFERRGIALELDGVHRLIAACARNDRAAMEALAAREPGLRDELIAQGGRSLGGFAGNGNVEGVRCLLDLGVSANATFTPEDGYWGLTRDSPALHVAAWRAWPAVVKELIARGAEVNASDERGRTALQLAVKACVDSYWTDRRTPESVAALLEAEATVSGIAIPSGYDEVDELLRRYEFKSESAILEG
jgi:ankyrin repeat protein